MVCSSKVGGRVSLWGVVTAADVTAGLAHPQMDPVSSAGRQAVLTTAGGWHYIDDLINVCADTPSHGSPFGTRSLLHRPASAQAWYLLSRKRRTDWLGSRVRRTSS